MGRLGYAPPAKRSVTIAGHQTSISLEPMFWTALELAAKDERLALSALVARIDAERIEQRPAPNLTSAIRQWLLARASDGVGEGHRSAGSEVEP
jgi:predicted DNA-binding ribbon-helix-helix protein